MLIFLLDATIESIEDRSSPNVALDQFINTPQFIWNDEEDLNRKKLPKNTNVLQTLQNSMIRVIYGLKKQNHVNMIN